MLYLLLQVTIKFSFLKKGLQGKDDIALKMKPKIKKAIVHWKKQWLSCKGNYYCQEATARSER
jgi:hypothetical protein